jgi:hypothetical protein
VQAIPGFRDAGRSQADASHVVPSIGALFPLAQYHALSGCLPPLFSLADAPPQGFLSQALLHHFFLSSWIHRTKNQVHFLTGPGNLAMKRIGESHFFLANLLNFILEGHNLIVYSVVVRSVGVFRYLLQGLNICDELSLESKGLAGFYFCELVEMGQGCELPSESQSGLGQELFLFVSHCGSIIIGLSLFL